MITLKRGASLRVAFKAETDDEWEFMESLNYAFSQVRFPESGLVFEMEVSIDPLSRCIYVKGDSDEWPLEDGFFDIKTVSGDLILPIPHMSNIDITVIQGAS